MLTQEQIKTAAERLYQAEQNRKQIPALTLQHPELDMGDAYAIQKAWVDQKKANGRSVIGYKVGLTSRAMQMAVNIDEPDYGVLLDDMLFEDGATLKASDFLDPRIEVELAFVLNKPLFGENVSIFDVYNATDYVIPSLELIAARCMRTDPETGYTRKVFDTISDNAANAGIILGGRPIKPTEMDLRWAGAALYLNGQIEETGLACGVLGHPAKGISWVCKRFAPHGVGLEPGQIILAGSFTRPVPVKAGDTVHADFGPLGGIGLRFE
ncbi:2-oxo-hept-4-ene-1,7-dioate hydratase [Marinobacterium lutimaris]|uniref:2-oxohept-3-enedioate hydratase n=1 Tax=Marinobacterium lutimaris TaxID=568106 RepID=A0A1H6C0J6_9GAMM|nr:2-oxo-hepta-3-ene-1,7-dioic acid hydratase [Marinobacterium lutimaris]SEG66468.1 2-oxohept-3-enedioate hydratase [Marinobacterium lutimaris]